MKFFFIFVFRIIREDRLRMNMEIRNKVEFIIAIVNEFAKAKHLTDIQAYRYLQRFKAISFVNTHYNVAHTLRMEDVLEDISAYCRRQGGAIV